MTLLETAAVAFAMFSAVPVPQPVWNEKNMRYALCAFPLVGVVCGLAWWGWAALAARLSFPLLLRAAGLCLAPVLVTGGIHLDGYADTCDALASCAAPEKKQEILKDPHCGAFAVIRLCTYFTAYLGLCAAVDCTPRAVLCMGLGFVLERALSGYAIAAFPLAKNTGLAHTFATGADRTAVRRALLVLCALAAAGMAADDGRRHGAGCGACIFAIPRGGAKAVRRHIGRPGRMVFAKGGAVDAGRAGSVQPAFGGDGMIFITGPLYSGKREYARLLLGCTREELAQRAVWDVQELAAGCGDLAALAQQLARNEVVIATEVGGGVVPVDKNERAAREAAGRLGCLLAQRADAVVRVFCGIPVYLKGAPNT